MLWTMMSYFKGPIKSSIVWQYKIIERILSTNQTSIKFRIIRTLLGTTCVISPSSAFFSVFRQYYYIYIILYTLSSNYIIKSLFISLKPVMPAPWTWYCTWWTDIISHLCISIDNHIAFKISFYRVSSEEYKICKK